MATYNPPAYASHEDKTETKEVTIKKKVTKGYRASVTREHEYSPICITITKIKDDEYNNSIESNSIDVPDELLEFVYKEVEKAVKIKRKWDKISQNMSPMERIMKKNFVEKCK